MHDEIDSAETRTRRRTRLALRLAVGLIWSFGVALAIRSGWEPGYWWDASRPWPYPLGHVLVVIAQITLVSWGLYDLLRPQEGGSSLARTARAAGAAFATLIWISFYMWTDQPGYAYVASTYVALVTGLLLLILLPQAAVTAYRALRRRGHAA